MAKKITVSINNTSLQILKQNNYRLCIARKVAEGDYNVVWIATDQYLAENSFSWNSKYQLFGVQSGSFRDRQEVRPSTNVVDIEVGGQCTLSKEGILGPDTKNGFAKVITMKNEYSSIRPAISQQCLDYLVNEFLPIYVGSVSVPGLAELTPLDKALIWFEQDIQTSFMFSQSRKVSTAMPNEPNTKSNRSISVELDLTGEDQATATYADGAWSKSGSKS